jgi:hypothetical protein
MDRMQMNAAKALYLSRPDHCPYCGRIGQRVLDFPRTELIDEQVGKRRPGVYLDGRQVHLDHEDFHNRAIYIEHECLTCGAIWHDMMKLVDVVVIQEGSVSGQVARRAGDPRKIRRVRNKRRRRYAGVRPSKANLRVLKTHPRGLWS